MTALESLFWRVLAADILLAVTWLLLGGSVLEIVIIAVLQAGLLAAVDGVVGAVRELVKNNDERRSKR